MASYRDAISAIESGGRYDNLGPVTKTGDRAYGRYQVMGANIPEWSQAALGRRVTPQEFLADPSLQDAVFDHRFGNYAQKYGPEGAARAWFAGEGGMNNMGAQDQLGTSVSSYAQRFNNAMGQGGEQPTEMSAQSRTPPPQNLDVFGAAPKQSGGFDFKGFGNSLTRMGAAAMSASNPKGAAALAGTIDEDPKDLWITQTLPDGRVIQSNRRDGSVRQVATAPKPPKQAQPFGETGLKKLIETETAANGTDWFNQQASQVLDDLKTNKLDLGVWQRYVANPLKVAAGATDDQRLALSRFEQLKQLMTNEQLLRAKGVQTEGDAVRALKQFFAGGAEYSNPTAIDALQTSLSHSRADLENTGRTYEAYGKLYGDDNPVIQHYRQLHDERMKRYAPKAAAAPAGNLNDLKKKYGLD